MEIGLICAECKEELTPEFFPASECADKCCFTDAHIIVRCSMCGGTRMLDNLTDIESVWAVWEEE